MCQLYTEYMNSNNVYVFSIHCSMLTVQLWNSSDFCFAAITGLILKDMWENIYEA